LPELEFEYEVFANITMTSYARLVITKSFVFIQINAVDLSLSAREQPGNALPYGGHFKIERPLPVCWKQSLKIVRVEVQKKKPLSGGTSFRLGCRDMVGSTPSHAL
jgi:hypothetical protein